MLDLRKREKSIVINSAIHEFLMSLERVSDSFLCKILLDSLRKLLF